MSGLVKEVKAAHRAVADSSMYDPQSGKQVLFGMETMRIMVGKASAASQVSSAWRDVRRAIKEFKWHAKTHMRFLIQEIFYRNDPIEVYDSADFSQSRCGYLDIQISLPGLRGGRQHKWVFTVHCRNMFLTESTLDDLHATLCTKYKNNIPNFREFLYMVDPAVFWPWIEKNLDSVMNEPEVTFDSIDTTQADFGEGDIVKYAKLWLERWYPRLAKNKIVLTEPDKRSEYRGVYGFVQELYDAKRFQWCVDKVKEAYWYPITRRYYKWKYSRKPRASYARSTN